MGTGADAVLACPACGGRLLTKTKDGPARLICSSCGKVLLQDGHGSRHTFLNRTSGGLLALALVVMLPMLLLAFSPWLGTQAPRRPEVHAGEGQRGERARWDRRSGIVGRSLNRHEAGN